MLENKMTGENFFDTRHDLNLTQEKLADFLKISTRQIQRYENGFSEIPGSTEILMRLLVTRRIPKI